MSEQLLNTTYYRVFAPTCHVISLYHGIVDRVSFSFFPQRQCLGNVEGSSSGVRASQKHWVRPLCTVVDVSSDRATTAQQCLHRLPNSTCLRARIEAGGHTGWSRAWLVNLRARLFQGTEALNSLRGLMHEQCVGSLYSLHPALSRSSDKKLADCFSCYEWDGADKARPPSAK